MKKLTSPTLSCVGQIFLLLIIATLFFLYIDNTDQKQTASRKDQLRREIFQLKKDLRRQIESLRGGIETQNTKEIALALERLGILSSSLQVKLGKGAKESKEAVKLAVEAWDNEEHDLAMIYWANAINANPSDVELLKNYAEWAIQSKDRGVTRGAASLMQSALYTVMPNDVKTVINLSEKLAEFGLKKEEAPEPLADRLPKEIANIEDQPLNKIADNREQLELRLMVLSGQFSTL